MGYQWYTHVPDSHYLLHEQAIFFIRGESKLEISTVSGNPTLRGCRGQVLHSNDCHCGFSLFNDCQD